MRVAILSQIRAYRSTMLPGESIFYGVRGRLGVKDVATAQAMRSMMIGGPMIEMHRHAFSAPSRTPPPMSSSHFGHHSPFSHLFSSPSIVLAALASIIFPLLILSPAFLTNAKRTFLSKERFLDEIPVFSTACGQIRTGSPVFPSKVA